MPIYRPENPALTKRSGVAPKRTLLRHFQQGQMIVYSMPQMLFQQSNDATPLLFHLHTPICEAYRPDSEVSACLSIQPSLLLPDDRLNVHTFQRIPAFDL